MDRFAPGGHSKGRRGKRSCRGVFRGIHRRQAASRRNPLPRFGRTVRPQIRASAAESDSFLRRRRLELPFRLSGSVVSRRAGGVLRTQRGRLRPRHSGGAERLHRRGGKAGLGVHHRADSPGAAGGEPGRLRPRPDHVRFDRPANRGRIVRRIRRSAHVRFPRSGPGGPIAIRDGQSRRTRRAGTSCLSSDAERGHRRFLPGLFPRPVRHSAGPGGDSSQNIVSRARPGLCPCGILSGRRNFRREAPERRSSRRGRRAEGSAHFGRRTGFGDTRQRGKLQPLHVR